MSSEDKQYGKPDKGQTDSRTDRQPGRQGDRQIDNGDPRQCSGGKLKMVMKMKSYEYHAPLVEVTQGSRVWIGGRAREVTRHVSAKMEEEEEEEQQGQE